MKSPWQIGLLALAVTGVATYDFMFFKNHQSEKQISIQKETDQPATGVAEPLLSPLPEPANAGKATGLGGADSVPPISREELRGLSQQAFIPNSFREAGIEASWPERDPFAADKVSEQRPHNISVIPLMNETPVSLPQQPALQHASSGIKETPAPLPPQHEPQCVFSGTLIEGENKLALVNGSPMSIGDRLGIWQLARIELDYIVLEVGKESYRIELKGAGPQAAHQKDPL
jgi:hypothetical protein